MDEVRTSEDQTAPSIAGRLHRALLILLQVAMWVELAALVWNGHWQNAAIVFGIIAITTAPLWLGERLPVRIPYPFQGMVVLFVFGALFLGEARDYYERFWWWDMLLHTSSGLLLGLLGFMLIYILNEDDRIHLDVRPGFMALFAFTFAVSFGAIWELFEFAVDIFFGTNMQKPMFGDATGLVDTMMDLLVDTLGAGAMALYGYRYTARGEPSFIGGLIERVTRENPEWFRARRFGRDRKGSGGIS